VIDHFVGEYLDGRTPNPCVLCNTHIKWDALLRRADKLSCDFIATGHYANVRSENGRYIISKGKDDNKDQSYALWGVSQESLSRTILPLGQLHKTEIRKMAIERGFDDLVKKPESYEICFVPDNDYRGFLKRRVPGLEESVRGGDFVLEDGTVVGKHEGYPFYTIGQRKGLGIALGYPIFVTAIDKTNNRVVLGTQHHLARNAMSVRQLSMSKYTSLENQELETSTKIRYNDDGTDAKITQEGDLMKVVFHEPVFAIAPGQAAVFYEGEDVVGGGWIYQSYNV
jgi:tRNA-uridine 2-sulfurtransferase